MGTCGQPGYVFRDFCLKQGIEFIIFCLKQGIKNRNSVLNRVGKSAIFVLNRVRDISSTPRGLMLTTAKITNSYRPEFFPASCNYPLSVPLVDYPFPKKSPYSIRHSVEASSTQTKKIQDRQKSHTENATPIIMWIASPWGRGGGELGI